MDENIFSTVLLLLIFLSAASQKNQLKDYTQTISGSDLSIDMVAIPAGEFKMGSSANEDEKPVHAVKIDPFWMAKYEITWDVYYLYLNREIDNEKNTNSNREINTDIDAISGATVPYIDMSLGMGTNGYPVANVTHLAASKFCEWLSAKTGYFYRLPTEAEWEYACRAGTDTKYSFGDDITELGEYAWYEENSQGRYQKGGQKKPNPWGLYDMHGNMAELTLDQYRADAYKKYDGKTADNPLEIPSKEYPHSVRGGSWDDDVDMLRSAARYKSNPNWKKRDPQLPKSKWWHTDAAFLGFRIVRVAAPNEKDYEKYWGKAVPRKK
ncbi:formylglycine-generating enzyme family protein [Aureibaculum sp. 2210JD6-5]|uniref:formylglycine-generating enzyme family protein n=1 Tax=Aureibaculum sp. 2210JD6-5 TaxID=3103957 RepID=UPI002AADB63B|nr:formylglycine-generating enzyme family protein [Aureibaculum sp. 2210JD6-5]MDY7395795.1 formylglycine-generating enzyme family protein [Aureibaculum sp. 2210JD6-5]